MWYFNSVVVTNETGNNGITGRRKLLARFQEDKLVTKNLIDSSYQNKKFRNVCILALRCFRSCLSYPGKPAKIN